VGNPLGRRPGRSALPHAEIAIKVFFNWSNVKDSKKTARRRGTGFGFVRRPNLSLESSISPTVASLAILLKTAAKCQPMFAYRTGLRP